MVFLILKLVELAFIIRVILRPNRDPAARIAWVVVIAVIPVLGIVAYLFLGETSIGRKRVARAHEVIGKLPAPADVAAPADLITRSGIPTRYQPLFHLGESVNGFPPVAGNHADLLPDTNSGIDALVADMDAAREHIHVLFYIWLTDNNGMRVIEALKRAAARGVAVRAMADGLGSRSLIKSAAWREMQQEGVKLGVALKIRHPLSIPLGGRADLRNHRKIVVIDNRITYCGSQNLSDPEFRIKPRFAPWVDMLVRFEGPVAAQNQFIFASDWMTYVDEDICDLVHWDQQPSRDGFVAQVIATGPTVRNSAMPEIFESLMHAARTELVITTPYYVPREAMQAALCSTARRGVATSLIVPARNDSREVAAASRSYYRELLEAGVAIHEFVGGLLHTKSLAVDGTIALIGSANFDRRSLDLNFENNILLYDSKLTTSIRNRQNSYIAASNQITLSEVENWPIYRKLGQNIAAMLGPVL